MAVRFTRDRHTLELAAGVDAAQLVERLAAEIRGSLGLRASITTAPPGSLPRFELKAERVVVRD